jgi:cell division septum initiation protein DivIVA
VTTTPVSNYEGGDLSGNSGPIRMTADRVRRWNFDSASFTRRGYDHQDVDRFRLQVADELDQLGAQLDDLRAENERLSAQVELYRHGVIPSNGAPRPGAKEVNLLSSAQREAEQIIAQAHDYARRVAEYARMQYESYLRAAVEEARQEAQRAVQDYRAAAGASFDDSVAVKEAVRIFGEMMISHMQAAARHLDDGSEQLTRMMDRINRESPHDVSAEPSDQQSGPVAPPRHGTTLRIGPPGSVGPAGTTHAGETVTGSIRDGAEGANPPRNLSGKRTTWAGDSGARVAATEGEADPSTWPRERRP